jgi:hypothetical protein
MPVVRSPFSNTTPPKPNEPVNKFAASKKRGDAIRASLDLTSAPVVANTAGTKTSKSEEQTKLDSAYSNALAKIASSPMTDSMKKSTIKQLDKTYLEGGKAKVPDSGFSVLGAVGGAVGGVLGAAGKGIIAATDATQTVSRFAQSGLKELGDMGAMYLDSGNAVRSKTGPRASWSDFVKQGKDKEFRLAPQTGVKWLDSTIDFAVDVALDPTSYVGVGAVGMIGKAGRAELAIKFGTEAMIAKHPQLIGKFDDIMRYGAAAIPKEVRAAEGVKYGVRFMGEVVPKTETVANLISGKKGVGTLLRGGVGDVIDKVGLNSARAYISPSSRAGLVAKQIGRNRGVADDVVLKELSHYTSARYSKGAKSQFYRTAMNAINGTVKEIRDAGEGVGADVLRIIEDPVLFASASPQKKQWAQNIIDWQNGKHGRGGVNAIYDKFNLDYAGRIKDIGLVDDYVHHRMTEDALKIAYGDKSSFKGYFKDADLTAAELGSNSGAALHRKYRKGEKFMDEELQTGSIDEINKIFRNKTKADVDFFETDIGAVMDGYAYSMAASRGREAYVRRLMDFGPDFAKVIDQKIVPDQKLVANLTASHASIKGLRRDIVTAVNKGAYNAKATALDTVKWAQNIMDSQSAKIGVIDRDVAVVQAKIAVIEKQLADGFELATQKGHEARGAFLHVHQSLIDEVQTLKHSIANGEMYQQAAYTKLRELYVQMYPDARRIPKSVDKLIDRIGRDAGMTATNTAEYRTLQSRLKVLQNQIAETPPDAGQVINDLLDAEAALVEQLDGFAALGEVRYAADYSEDGFIYGTYDDLVARPFNPNDDPLGRVVSTRPIVAGNADMTSDEMSAIQNAFMQDGRSVGAHAIPTDSMNDMRKPEHYYDFWDPAGGVGEATGFALRQAGVDPDDVFVSSWNEMLQSGEIDPMFEQVYPALSELQSTIAGLGSQKFELGVVDDDFLNEAFDVVRQNFKDAAAELGLENSDYVGDQMMQDFMRAMVEEGMGASGKPLLLPSGVLYGLDNPMAEGAYSIMLPDGFSYAKQYGKDAIDASLVDGTTSPIFRTTDELMQSVANSDYVSASLGAIEKLDAVATEGRVLQDALSAKHAAQTEVRGVAGSMGVVKREASRRMKEAERAWKDYENFKTVTIPYRGKKIQVSREKAISILNEKETKINNLVADLEVRIGNIGAGDAEKLRIRKLVQEERLSTLLDQRKVLQNWSDKTGAALQADIDMVRQAIATDAPDGAAGTVSRKWSDKVRDTMNNIPKMGDTPEARAWERVVTQLHADEAQLALLDSTLIPMADNELALALSSKIGGTLKDDITDGWEALGKSLGIEVPKDFLDIARPQLDKLKLKANQGPIKDAILKYHQFFKVYATMSVGFITRNAISSTFMNYVAGVSGGNIKRGVEAVTALAKHGPDKWLDELGIVDPAVRELYETALRAVDATGRGLQSEIATQPLLKGSRAAKIYNKTMDNWFTRTAGKGNDFTERAARFPMALDTLERGLSYDEAIYRVSRYHFDYSDLSKFDEQAKKFIPFWIWTSRNIPLQMTEQIYRPKAYIQYQNIKDRNPVSSDVIMPEWLKQNGPMGLVGSWVINPDLPMTRLQQQAEAFASPTKLIGQMYPTYKLPFEMIARRQMSNGVPFTDKYDEAKGLDRLMAEISMKVLGDQGLPFSQGPLARVNADGKTELDPFVSYGIGNAIPLIAKIQRLTGGLLGGKPTYQERTATSWLSEFGIPVRNVGEREQRGATIGKQFDIAELMKELARRGLVEKNK